MAEIEILAMPDEARRRRVHLLLPEARIELTRSVFDRAKQLTDFGLHAADAVHIAAAETLADVFLTCDDQLQHQCNRIVDKLQVSVANPAQWLQEQNDAEDAG
jgi:predicted nucleic acid-binding protein